MRGERSGGRADLGRIEERLAELERLAGAVEDAPDAEVVAVLERAVTLLAEVNAGIEDGLRASEAEARELSEVLEGVDFGPLDRALEDLGRPSGSTDPGGGGGR